MTFFHGDDHGFLPARDVVSLAEAHDNLTARIFAGSAQLALCERPREIAAQIMASLQVRNGA